MSLIETIKAEYMTQRRARASWQVASLSTLIGEIETLAKGGKAELTDAAVVAVIKKFIKNIDETLNTISGNGATVAVVLQMERALYAQFLPKQLNEAELKAVIDELIAAGNTNVGDVMKALKTNHSGHYDGAMASAILKARFAK